MREIYVRYFFLFSKEKLGYETYKRASYIPVNMVLEPHMHAKHFCLKSARSLKFSLQAYGTQILEYRLYSPRHEKGKGHGLTVSLCSTILGGKSASTVGAKCFRK
jgi:hypothetical protein